MRTSVPLLVPVGLLAMLVAGSCVGLSEDGFGNGAIDLPAPVLDGAESLESALAGRRSVRSFSDRPLAKEHIAQLLWSAAGTVVDGITGATRTAPSAGATHPLEVYLVVRSVDGLEAGVYRYDQGSHALVSVKVGEVHGELARAGLNQRVIADAPASVVVGAVYERTTARYLDRGIRYVHMEVGHAAQNVLLQVEVLELSAVVIGAFHDEQVKEVLGMEAEPLAIIPVGFP